LPLVGAGCVHQVGPLPIIDSARAQSKCRRPQMFHLHRRYGDQTSRGADGSKGLATQHQHGLQVCERREATVGSIDPISCTLQACDTLPSCLASSNRPTLARITFCSCASVRAIAWRWSQAAPASSIPSRGCRAQSTRSSKAQPADIPFHVITRR
jgi:hypothetical protein